MPHKILTNAPYVFIRGLRTAGRSPASNVSFRQGTTTDSSQPVCKHIRSALPAMKRATGHLLQRQVDWEESSGRGMDNSIPRCYYHAEPSRLYRIIHLPEWPEARRVRWKYD